MSLITCIKRMKKAAFVTLGCRVNQYETQAIREALFRHGFEEGTPEDTCDLYLVNTCAVTGESERKDRQMIRRALRQKEQNPNALVCVCGCFSQGAGEKEKELFSQVDVLAGNTQKDRLADILARLSETPLAERERLDLREDISKVRAFEKLRVEKSHNARAFVKIEDGCNSFCSYCYVPIVRGRVRSRPLDDVVEEVRHLAGNGYQEIVLTGIETGAYGEDLDKKTDLPALVEALHGISGLQRIRFGSLKPTLFTREFCARLSALPAVMPHFHLSLQSGSTRVLSAMGRRYGRREEEEAIDAILSYFPDAGLSADLICGFPGESREDFLETVSLVENAGLLHTHIFPFSPREGTRAARLCQTVSQEEKRTRCAELFQIAKKQSAAFAEKREGKVYHVLCERIRDGAMFGYTENFIYTKIPLPQKGSVGQIYEIRLGSEKNFSVETMTVSGKSIETVDNFGKKL